MTAGEHLGISLATLRQLGRPLRHDDALALALWESGILDARLLATLVDDPAQVTGRRWNAGRGNAITRP